MSKRKINVKGTGKATVTKSKGDARKVTVRKQSKRGLFFFQMTPAGDLLRAYFVALMQAQIGGLVENRPFKVWPAANLLTHTANGRLKKEGKVYMLTKQGVNYFADPKQAPDKEVVAAMYKAVTTGERPSCYKYEMSPLAE